MFLPKDLFAVRVRYSNSYDETTDETIALVTSELQAREAVRKWFHKHKKDESMWVLYETSDYMVNAAKKYKVYFDKIEADGTIDNCSAWKDVEFTIHDVLV